MDPTQTTGMKPWQWGVTVAVIVIILGLIGYFVFRSPSEEVPNPTDNPNTTINDVLQNGISVSDQFPGNSVYLSGVQLVKPGFVVIHKNNNGTPGVVIGSQWFDKGSSPAGRVTLSESMVDKQSYFAVLHDDVNGDKTFTEATDVTIKDAQGTVIMKMFRALADLPELKG